MLDILFITPTIIKMETGLKCVFLWDITGAVVNIKWQTLTFTT